MSTRKKQEFVLTVDPPLTPELRIALVGQAIPEIVALARAGARILAERKAQKEEEETELVSEQEQEAALSGN